MERRGERREGAFAAGLPDPREQRHGNLADRFLDYFDLRLFYIYATTTPLTARLDIPGMTR